MKTSINGCVWGGYEDWKGVRLTADEFFAQVAEAGYDGIELGGGVKYLGTPKQCLERARRFGLEIGRAFQLVDDLLDYTSTSEAMGKPVFSDLHEGKLTLPLLTLLERAPADVRPVIQRIWAAGEEVPIHPADEQALRRMLEAHDAYAETRALARQASAAATAALMSLDGDPSTKKLLLEIPEFLLARSS